MHTPGSVNSTGGLRCVIRESGLSGSAGPDDLNGQLTRLTCSLALIFSVALLLTLRLLGSKWLRLLGGASRHRISTFDQSKSVLALGTSPCGSTMLRKRPKDREFTIIYKMRIGSPPLQDDLVLQLSSTCTDTGETVVR